MSWHDSCANSAGPDRTNLRNILACSFLHSGYSAEYGTTAAIAQRIPKCQPLSADYERHSPYSDSFRRTKCLQGYCTVVVDKSQRQILHILLRSPAKIEAEDFDGAATAGS